MNVRKTMIIAVAVFCAAVLAAGCNSDSSPLGSEAPILPPQNVSVQQNFGTVVITWDGTTQSNLRGYNVYRNDIAESAIERLTSSPITATYYEDTTFEYVKAYQYWVTSVSTAGGESNFSPVSIATIAPNDRTGMKPFRN